MTTPSTATPAVHVGTDVLTFGGRLPVDTELDASQPAAQLAAAVRRLGAAGVVVVHAYRRRGELLFERLSVHVQDGFPAADAFAAAIAEAMRTPGPPPDNPQLLPDAAPPVRETLSHLRQMRHHLRAVMASLEEHHESLGREDLRRILSGLSGHRAVVSRILAAADVASSPATPVH